MNKRQLKSKIDFLRKLYAEMDVITETGKTEMGKNRAKRTSNHLKCSVTLLLDTWEAEN